MKKIRTSPKEILEIARRDRCGSLDRYFGLGSADPLIPQQRLLLEAAQFRMDEGRLKESLDYCCASLRLATFWASGLSKFERWPEGDSQQAETLRVIIDWANHQAAANESLLPAIQRVREELARFPSLQKAVATQYLCDVQLLEHVQRNVYLHPFGPEVVMALLPTEVARAQRVLDQQLFWRWCSIQSLEVFLQQPGVNAPRLFAEYVKQDAEFDRDERLRSTTPLARTHRFLDEMLIEMIVNREVVIRETLLAMAMLEWKRVHHEMPDYLGSLAPYCVIEKQEEEDRVLPVMALNDPWTGELFEYTGFGLRDIESRADQPIAILYSAGPNPSRTAARSVSALHPNLIDHVGGSMSGSMIRSHKGKLSLVIPPKPKR